MRHSFLFDTSAATIVIVLFFIMVIAIIIGYSIGKKSKKNKSDDSGIQTSLLGLLALLMAFTFSMAGSRFENRKSSLIEEANCIGTAILRADIYPDSVKNAFKTDFKNYLNARITYFESKRVDSEITAALKQADESSQSLWKRASFYAKDKDYFIQSQMMLPALNEMFDIATTTNTVFNSGVPESIIYLLLFFSIVISFYIGYSSGHSKKVDSLYLSGFCFLTCVVIFIILDLDRPRRGAINLENEIVLLKDLNTLFEH